MRWTPIFLLGLAVACGADGSTRPTKTQEDAWLGFARCLRTEGIKVADPTFLSDGGVKIAPASGAPIASRDVFDAAVDECRPILSAAGLKPPGDEEPDRNLALEDRALAFAKCARAAGYELPDPVIEGGRVANWNPAELGIDLEDPETQRAADGCARQSGFDPRKE